MACPITKCHAAPRTLVITHDHCALHNTRMVSPERPKRLKWVMSALELLSRDIQRDLKDTPSRSAMWRLQRRCWAPAEELVRLAHSGGGPSPATATSLMRSDSVGYLEEKILPAVKAVHTRGYIERLASTCVSLRDKADGAKAERDDDTVVSASSLSAALCAILSCCYAIDSVCDAALPYTNAFAVIRPPGHHAGADGATVGPQHFAEASSAAAHNARPVASISMAPPPPAFAFTQEPVPCDGLDCSQGFCLLNNAAIAARHALVSAASGARLPAKT